MTQLLDGRTLTTLALSQTLRIAVREALCSDPDNPLALAVQSVTPDNFGEYDAFVRSLSSYSQEQLEEMLHNVPPSYLSFRIVSALEKKDQ